MRERSRRFIISIPFVLCFLMAVNAQPELDITFNGSGKATVDMVQFDEYGRSVLVQADNKVIVAGTVRKSINMDDHFALARFNADGSLDTTFGDQGKVITIFDPNGIYEGAYAAGLQSDGKIVVSGYVSLIMPGPGYFAVARYNTNGSIDTTFGNNGKIVAPVTQHINEIHAMTITPDGRIFVAGRFFDGQAWQTAVLGFSANGSTIIFSASNRGGWQLNDTNVPTCIAVQPDGKVIVGITYYIYNFSNTDVNAKFVRFNADGTNDSSFNGFGNIVIPSPGVSETVSAITVLPDGKILAAGSNNGNFLLMRLNSGGSLDSTFDGDGRVLTPIDGGGANAMMIRPNGQIISSGLAGGGFGVVVQNADGSLDTSFSGDGKLIVDGAYIAGHNMGFDSLGRIVLGGTINGMFAAARLYTLEPTAVSISGRILTPEGTPIRGVSVGLSNQAGDTQWTLSSPFGYYQFAGIMTGQTYTVHVSSKRFLVDDKLFGLNEELADFDLTGVPRTENAEKLKR